MNSIDFKWSYVENPQKPHEKPIDKNLGDRLLKELPEILKWLVEGALEYQRINTLDIPDCIYDNVREYKESTDNYKLFVEDCVQLVRVEKRVYYPARKLYELYTLWSRYHGYKGASEKIFATNMKRLGLEKHDKRIRNCFCYVNIMAEESIIYDLAPLKADSLEQWSFFDRFKCAINNHNDHEEIPREQVKQECVSGLEEFAKCMEEDEKSIPDF
ncbi:hypothetical protein [Desulfonatronum parangueonense]